MIYLNENNILHIAYNESDIIPEVITKKLEFQKIFEQEFSNELNTKVFDKKSDQIFYNNSETSKIKKIDLNEDDNILDNFNTQKKDIQDLIDWKIDNKLKKNFNKKIKQDTLKNIFLDTYIINHEKILLSLTDFDSNQISEKVELSKNYFLSDNQIDFSQLKQNKNSFLENKKIFEKLNSDLKNENFENIQKLNKNIESQKSSEFIFEKFNQENLKRNINQKIDNLSNLDSIHYINTNKFYSNTENKKFIQTTYIKNFDDVKFWINLVKEKVESFKKDGVFHFEFKIHPKNLGSVNIILKSYKSKLKLHVSSKNSEVRDILKNSLEELRKSLLDNGILLDSAIISNHHSGNVMHNKQDSIFNNIENQNQYKLNEKDTAFNKERKKNKKEQLNLNKIENDNIYKNKIQYIFNQDYTRIDMYA